MRLVKKRGIGGIEPKGYRFAQGTANLFLVDLTTFYHKMSQPGVNCPKSKQIPDNGPVADGSVIR
ncbi:hypothetical protein J31TS4_21350 [Paenibacillus sp. J31TS4]|nr:hypothetical protein J31TS4_21350 [Paenibacillus sp. J31TS4]